MTLVFGFDLNIIGGIFFKFNEIYTLIDILERSNMEDYLDLYEFMTYIVLITLVIHLNCKTSRNRNRHIFELQFFITRHACPLCRPNPG